MGEGTDTLLGFLLQKGSKNSCTGRKSVLSITEALPCIFLGAEGQGNQVYQSTPQEAVLQARGTELSVVVKLLQEPCHGPLR